jgi:acrylyl-CoA reductase (NADPH)
VVVVNAFLIDERSGQLELSVRDLEPERRDDADILVRVEFSGINFKDAMAAESPSRVRRVTSLVGGVDAAGVVVESRAPEVPVGSRVAVHGGDLGVGRAGGFAEFVYAPRRFVNVLPESISTRDAMVIGTAGFTAMASVLALETHGVDPTGEVLVTGATGGVGSMAVAMLAARGHHVVASTGSLDQTPWLLERGAVRVIGRDEVTDRLDKVLGSELWAGAVDCIGGATLAHVIRSLRYGAAVAASGLVAGAELTTTVYPFITRAASLLGIDAVEMNIVNRERVWAALDATMARLHLEPLIDRTVTLHELPGALEVIRKGHTRGRILVEPARA